jgi:hypothetical protein
MVDLAACAGPWRIAIHGAAAWTTQVPIKNLRIPKALSLERFHILAVIYNNETLAIAGDVHDRSRKILGQFT